jgi:hypothetical protein
MDRISRFFVRRLRHLSRREALRNAALHGVLGSWIVEDGTHTLRLYGPAFDTTPLTGDLNRDLDRLRRQFGVDSIRSPMSTSDAMVATDPAPPRLTPSRRKRGRRVREIAPIEDLDHRSYAVRLIGAMAEPPLVSNIAAALLLARAVADSGKPLRETLRKLMRAAPIVALHAPIAGFERAVTCLIETPGFIPGNALDGIDGDYVFNERTFDATEDPSRRYVSFTGENIHRLTDTALRRRLVNALVRDYPVVAIAEKRKHIPPEIAIAADIDLTAGKLNHAFVGDMIEAVYGIEGGAPLDDRLGAHDVGGLSLDDMLLAFRPGREANEAVDFLVRFAERDRAALDGEDDDGEDDESGGNRGKASASKTKSDARQSGSDASSTSPSDKSQWKRDKPSGAEIIQPEPSPSNDKAGSQAPLTVETLSGYGRARTWALDLKADLADYEAAKLAWAEMSTKLLLSGPPGTGKTTFARALCNSLQVPLVVTSVSTWLQGGHLSDVIEKMAKTFSEARALAPAILFIDEIDGIGKRQPVEREYADYWNTVVNKALELLDGAVKSEGLIIVGATNRPEQIDEALKRSGRLETHIDIPKPDVATLADILAHHLGDDVEALVSNAGPAMNAKGSPGDREPSLPDDPAVLGLRHQDAPDLVGNTVNRKGAGR